MSLTEYLSMNVKINKDKSIGKVLYIVEGGSTEFFILSKIFNKILDYQFERITRTLPYKKFNSKVNPTSKVFVINTETSNIKTISKDNEFLDNLFTELIESYDFDVNDAAIYYLFDRDPKSNTDIEFISYMLKILKNARDNDDYDKQGLLLLSYPSIESFTLSNFRNNSFDYTASTGDELKDILDNERINQSRISTKTLSFATNELLKSLERVGLLEFDIDNFGETNIKLFEHQENIYYSNGCYRALSLLCISLIDLGIIEITD